MLVEPEAINAMLENLQHYEITTGVICHENEQMEVMIKPHAIVPALHRVEQRKVRDGSRGYAELSGAIARRC